MKNPFEKFKDYQSPREEIPLDSIVRSKDIVISNLVAGYESIVEEEIKSLLSSAEEESV